MSTIAKIVPVQDLNTKDIAALIRKALKLKFKGVKFSVTSDHSAIRVTWTDGPASDRVNEVAGMFETRGFDGMIDMAYGMSFYLLEDGTAVPANCKGTGGSKGSVSAYTNDAPDNAVCEVKGHAMVQVQRDLSDEWIKKAGELVKSEYGFEVDMNDYLSRRRFDRFVEQLEESGKL